MEEVDAAATMVDENRLKYSLDALCAWRKIPGKDDAALLEGCRALGLIPKGRKKFIPQAHIWRLPARFVHRYAEQDTISTLLLFEDLNPVLDRENTRGAYQLEINLLAMVHAMRKHGIKVNTARVEEVRDMMLNKRDSILKQFSEKHGATVRMTTVRSDKQLAKICDGYGIKYPLTEKGNPSFTAGLAGWLDKSDHWLPPFIANVRRYDSSAKLIENIIDHVQGGRVFADIHPHKSDIGGTRTSRFSYSHPALQQTPKHNEELAPLIRSLYLPEEGEVWASCDLSQHEFRMIVQYAIQHKLPGAAEMRDEYIRNPRLDIHQAAADRSNGVLNRHGGKGLNFGKFYGMGVDRFARTIDKPEAEARKLYELYDQIMPFVSQFSEMCKQAVWRNGHLTLLDGMRAHFDQWVAGIGKWKTGAGPCSREEAERRTHDPSHPWYGERLYRADARKGMNTLIQGSSARYTKKWMLEVWKAGITPILQMHDSLDLSVSSPEQAEIVARLGEEVGRTLGLKIPMVVEIGYGPNWMNAEHSWEKRHATGSHGELVGELSDSPERTSRESPKLSSVFDETLISAIAESELDTASDADSLPWKGDPKFEDTVAASTGSNAPEPPHICAQCKLDPPDGTEHTIDDGNTWMHSRCENAYILARMGQEGLFLQTGEGEAPPQLPRQSPSSPPASQQSPPQDKKPSGGDGRSGNGAWRSSGSRTATERNTYSEEHAGDPFDDAYLRKQGYKLVRVFDYTLANRAPLYQHNRYELKKGYTPSKKRQRKQFLTHRMVNGNDVLGAGNRRVIYNWPAIMVAGPGSYVFVGEGENKAQALIDAGLLATTVLSHKWTPECVAALTGYHLIILADHDKDGEKLASAAQRKLALVAASTRIVPASHLWKHLSDGKGPEPNDDVVDWIKLGGDPAKLLDICREIPADGIIVAAPYQPPAEASIPPWEWLYGRHLLRGEVSATVATGGTGKSTLSIAEALAEASGRALLGVDVPKPLRVVLINLEDTHNTMTKRIAAVMRHCGLTAADIDNRLIVIAKGEIKIKVARQLRTGDVERNEQTIRALTRLMTEHHGDVLSIDSLIRTHKVNENDNSAMQEVIECYEDAAVDANCAVHLWHHTRKPGGEKVTVESARGASAIIDACRSARVLEKMTAKEHEELSTIAPDMLSAGHYFRSFHGKLSFAPPADQSDWHTIENITLANGDDVGVVTRWKYPASQAAITPEVAKRIVAEIGDGMPNGQRFSNHPTATKRQVWPIVQKHCLNKTKNQCRRIVASWIERGSLYEDEYDDPIDRKSRKGLFARPEED
jgi:DNA polymerase I-like protein with 3'-5' exonuclease and polymerase domains